MDKKEYNELLEWDEKLNRETEEYIKKLYGDKTRVIEVRYKNHGSGGFIKIDLVHNEDNKKEYPEIIDIHKLVGYKQELKNKVVYGRMGGNKTHFKFKDKSKRE